MIAMEGPRGLELRVAGRSFASIQLLLTDAQSQAKRARMIGVPNAKPTGPAVGLEEEMLKIVFWTVAILACGLFALTVWYVSHEVKSYE